MIPALDPTLLSDVSGTIASRMGLHFPEERWPDLARGLTAASAEMGFAFPGAFLGSLRSQELTARQIETLASHLTVGETYFLRDPASFELLEREILPALVARRLEAGRTLRLWSAACCTGEEAYSLAITCARALPDLPEWNVSILASDINPRFLARAEAGVYSEWSFRGAPAWLRDRFFSSTSDKTFTVCPAVKRLVHFSTLNLAEDTYPSLLNHTNAMDVIFCRNVLMYFTPEHQSRVAAALHHCLVDGGYLLVNPAEASPSLFPMFDVETIDGTIVFRKTSLPIRVASRPEIRSPSPALPVPEQTFVVVPAPPVPVAPTQPMTPDLAFPREDHLVLARASANRGRLEEALASCRKAIAAESTSPVTHFLYATICHELGRFDEAVGALGRVLYLDQDFIPAHYALGDLYRRLGKQKESTRHLAVALALLSSRGRDEILLESDGMTCGRLLESVRAMTEA